MRQKKTFAYITAALAAVILCIIVVVVMLISLSSMNVSYRPCKSEEEGIIARTAQLVSSNPDVDEVALRVGSGMYSVGDYVIRSMTSAEYLSRGISDDQFAMDLTFALYGDYDTDAVGRITDSLNGHTRMYAINKEISRIDSKYAASGSISENSGDSFENCVITKPLEGSDGYTIGIRSVEGTIETTGSGMRTDFFVDDALYQGNIVLSNSDSNSKSFVMSWNTAGVEAGEHNVIILLRSSDGRGNIIDGGDINVPHCFEITNNSVADGSLDAGSQNTWFYLNAMDSNAYVNFVDLSDDIKVTMYDAYGELVGTNDLADSKYEILRGKKQDVEAISAATGIYDVSNSFYVKVERGQNCENPDENITFKMVQSREVARYNGEYMAVLDDVGAVPTPVPSSVASDPPETVRLASYAGVEIEADYNSVSFLPINGVLTTFKMVEPGTDKVVDFFPEFSNKITDYGYYRVSGNQDVRFVFESQDGYTGYVNSVINIDGSNIPYSEGDSFTIKSGETHLKIELTTFDGDVRTYNLFILNGDDNGSFSEDTLSNFPSSYGSGLWLLHNLHPNYNFRAYNVGIDFNTVLDNEDSGSRSLANVNSHPWWVKSDSPVYDGGGWMAARNEVVQYFLDPRNYFDQQHIFAFEMLSFDSTAQTVDGVRNVVAGSFMDTTNPDYAQIIYNAGQTADVSPYFLSSRILQEMGYSGQSALCHGTLEGYEGYYNFYNIGSTPDPDIPNGALINGAKYAQWGRNPDEQEITPEEAELLLPWDNVEDAITGGALWIASRYTSAGQDTLYFQKFDVIDNTDGLYEHQYAQNISMAYSEGARYYSGYASIGMLEESFTFVIPVYVNMPEQYGHMPATGA